MTAVSLVLRCSKLSALLPGPRGDLHQVERAVSGWAPSIGWISRPTTSGSNTYIHGECPGVYCGSKTVAVHRNGTSKSPVPSCCCTSPARYARHRVTERTKGLKYSTHLRHRQELPRLDAHRICTCSCLTEAGMADLSERCPNLPRRPSDLRYRC